MNNKFDNRNTDNIYEVWDSPLKLFHITSNYGWRIHPIFKKRIFHDGIDLRSKLNTPVYAVADGIVEYVGLNGSLTSGYGKYIRINHGDGLKSFYAHLNSYNVISGQKVKRGQQIALSGNTGGSQAPHLHFGARKNNTKLNPLDFLKNIT